MSTAQTIAKNTFFLFVLRASGFVLSFVLGMRLGRVLGTDGLGIYTLATTYLQVFVLLPNFGFDTLAIRDLARDRENAGPYVASVVVAKLLLMIPAYAILFAIVAALGYPPETTKAILILSACLFFDPLAEIAAAVFQGFERMELLTMISGTSKVLFTTASVILLERGAGPVDVLLVQLVGSAAVVPVFAWMTRRLLPGSPFGVDWGLLKRLMHESMPLFLTNLVGLLYLRTDVLMLSKLRGESEVGLYGAAASVLRALSMLPGIFVTAIYPTLSRMFGKDGSGSADLERLCNIAFRWQLVLGIPIVAGISGLGSEIIDLVYGEKFAESGPALTVLIWTLLFFFTNTLLGYMLYVANRQRDFLGVKVFTLIANVALNLALIPRLGIQGAAWATVLTTFVSFFFHERLVAKHIYRVRFLTITWKPQVGAALLLAVIQALRGAPLWLIVSAGAATFAVSQLALRFWTKEDLEIIRRVWERKKSTPSPVEAPRKSP